LVPKRDTEEDKDVDESIFSRPHVSSGGINASSIETTIYVPPCVAASAGLFQFAPTSLKCAYLRRIGSISVQGTNGRQFTRPATKVVVREMAASTIRIEKPGASWGNFTKDIQDESLRRYFLQEGANGMRLDAPRLMAMGTIFTVPNIQDKGGGTSVLSKKFTVNDIRFYEVISIGGDEDRREYGSSMSCAYIVVSLSTKLVLEEREEDRKWPRRLPSLNQTLNFALSMSIGEITEKAGIQSPRQTSRHPSIGPIIDKLLFPSSNLLQVSDYITFVVGNDCDRINESVSCAANAIGMRCVSISGLAAFDYRNKQQKQRSSANEAERPKSNVTGSLAEKLSGLQAAIDVATQSMPCIVFLKYIDKELTAADVDADTRIEEEKRFAAVLTNAIAKIPLQCGDVPNDFWNYMSLPIQFVVSSSKPLAPGPLSSLSMKEAVKVSRPDSKYAQQLWENDVREGSHACVDHDHFPSYEQVRSTLIGRTATEIVFARQMIAACLEKGDNMNKLFTTLPSVFSTIDKGPIVVAEGGESKLSSALIPNIKWEDIGGLSHVRSEVLDAIELPLRHPNLFSRGGRSGLCLFGPPGTGKTLVAKAVATECGLPFLSVKGPELLGSYVGESEANVRAAFQNAREAAAAKAGQDKGGAAILFFDELDSLAPRRGGVGDGGGVMERVVATLLSEMDSGSNSQDATNGRVFVIGATNRPDLLDPSLLRPGRFDRLVYLGLAQSREDRIKILAAQTRKFTFEGDQNALAIIDEIIDSIPASLSGADLSAVAKGALMRSMKRLCDEADCELARIRSERKDSYTADIETVVNNWDQKKLVPRVRAEDFINAAKDVTPSVGAKEFAKYERLKEQFCAY